MKARTYDEKLVGLGIDEIGKNTPLNKFAESQTQNQSSIYARRSGGTDLV